ncbi:hypothetical protein VTP01DRAFT_41 [Rhizomucor pusillus]|uniref:uncharacterized protein n=1 Tax=Rhizomucor pusillus TaxID=4840 RepID=UPI0037433058
MPTAVDNASDTIQPSSSSPHTIYRQDVINCSFSSWYKEFRNVTFRSKIYALPPTFIDYLNADNIYLPDDGQPRTADEDATEFSDEDDEDDEGDINKKPNFPEIEQFIRDSIRQLGGAVIPKLNWSSPKDAAWISATQSLKCTSPFDVFLLLKSSDFINHDLNFAFEHCSEQEPIAFDLILREWRDLQPSMEFRVFVKDRAIIGISQRDPTYYEFMNDVKEDIEDMIYDFFEDVVRDKFPSQNYAFDVYVDRDRCKVWLMDFNPFSPATDALLYTWEELRQFGDDSEAEIRIVETQTANSAPRFATNMVPKDVVDLSDGRTVAEFAEEFQRAMALAGQSDSDSDDDTDDHR